MNRHFLHVEGTPELLRGTTDMASVDTAVLRLENALRTLAWLGVDVPPDSRLPRALRTLQLPKWTVADPPDSERLLRHVEAISTAEAFMYITAAAQATKPDHSPFTPEKLAEAILGPDVPTGDHDHARNIQFELMFPALLRLTGILVRRGEPDARFQLMGHDIGIETKRVRVSSRRALTERVDKAAKQIRDAKPAVGVDGLQRGIIALGVDVYLADVMLGKDAEENMHAAHHALKELQHIAHVLVKRPGVVGVICMGRVHAWEALHTEAGPIPHLREQFSFWNDYPVGFDAVDTMLGEYVRSIVRGVGETMLSLAGKYHEHNPPPPAER